MFATIHKLRELYIRNLFHIALVEGGGAGFVPLAFLLDIPSYINKRFYLKTSSISICKYRSKTSDRLDSFSCSFSFVKIRKK